MFNNLPLSFAQPYFLLLLILVPFLVRLQWKQKSNDTTLNLPSASHFIHLASAKMKWVKWSEVLIWLAICTGIIALARPQKPDREEVIKSKGIDIILALDISSSMLAQDFKPNRLEIAKKMATQFVKKRTVDRIGLVAFSGEALTQCPLTSDHEVLLTALENLKNGALEGGTAIGMALATAVNRIKDSQAKSKVIILLTDGVDEGKGYIAPLTAAELARANGIKVYTIGIGTSGLAPMPYFDQFGEVVNFKMEPVFIDEAMLTRIADLSNGGRYFRARDIDELNAIYSEIDLLEKTDIDFNTIKQKTELFFPFLLFSTICLSLYFLLQYSIFR